MRQFARARIIDEYDVTMTVPHGRVTSQFNCDDVTMLSQNNSVVSDSGKISDQWLFLAKLYVQDTK